MRFNSFLRKDGYVDYEIKNNQIHFETEHDVLLAADSYAHYVEITDEGRWHNHKQGIIQENDTGRFFEIAWSEAATEYQESHASTLIFDEVEPYEEHVIVTRWKKK